MRRSSQLRRVRFGQHITESQRFRPGFVITEHSDKYFLVSWYARAVEHHRGDEGAVKAELVARMEMPNRGLLRRRSTSVFAFSVGPSAAFVSATTKPITTGE